MNYKLSRVRAVTYSAFFLALALVLPFLTGQIPQIGTLLSPMHIPVMLCGLIVGQWYGLAVGLISPLFRNAVFHMPPIGAAVPMSAELAVYGLVSALVYRLLSRQLGRSALYISLAVSMLSGRVANAAVKCVMLGSVSAFLAVFIELFTGTWVGMAVQLAVIPPLVMAAERYLNKNLN